MRTIQDSHELLKQIENINPDDHWPEEIFDISDEELSKRKITILIKANILPDGEFKSFRVRPSDTVFEVMQAIAKGFGSTLLPPEPLPPLDQLFCYGRDNQLIGPIDDLSQPIWKVIVRY